MSDPLAALLRSVPTIRALTGRLGTFNDAWWERFADELTARGVRVGDEGLRAALMRIEGWSRNPKGLTRPGVTRTIGLIHEEAEAALAATPTPPEIDVERRICRRYFNGHRMACKVHGTPSARCEDWEAGFQFARSAATRTPPES